MSRQEHICVFHSKGRSFADALKYVRERRPEARICAMAPSGYPVGPEELASADEVIETEREQYSPRDFAALRQLVRQLRRTRFDCFVILFDSPKLRALAALSCAQSCTHLTLDGRLRPITPSLPGVAWDVLYRNIRGRLTYAWIWIMIRCTRIGTSA